MKLRLDKPASRAELYLRLGLAWQNKLFRVGVGVCVGGVGVAGLSEIKAR